jgi:hypothetical protein
MRNAALRFLVGVPGGHLLRRLARPAHADRREEEDREGHAASGDQRCQRSRST